MPARYIIAAVAIAVLAVGAKLILTPKNAGAIFSQGSLDIQQMHKEKNVQNIPAQDTSDMSVVFDRHI